MTLQSQTLDVIINLKKHYKDCFQKQYNKWKLYNSWIDTHWKNGLILVGTHIVTVIVPNISCLLVSMVTLTVSLAMWLVLASKL